MTTAKPLASLGALPLGSIMRSAIGPTRFIAGYRNWYKKVQPESVPDLRNAKVWLYVPFRFIPRTRQSINRSGALPANRWRLKNLEEISRQTNKYWQLGRIG
ncbi:hypothetical protein EYR41_002654 [Orbilia oligospora]|uniref:Uncharacterized protein n=1 Tax=Orbilia oligospora TaxID=2813651 RepID=A0A7C8KBZ0_ORBOL|nr:hypothetical protein TWF751_002117 [Orbilia oligospora]TGJ70619.1 hypothetical protein EYR41_002654 [Orbilia oligospora]